MMTEGKLFISHSSKDREVAQMLTDYFVNSGLLPERIFCSSLPGYDVQEKIVPEIRNALKQSCVNLAILSKDYYASESCLNEAGIIWFLDVPRIIVGLPEIRSKDMVGLLDSNYGGRIRRLDEETDISAILKQVETTFSLNVDLTRFTAANETLRKRYDVFIKNRAQKTDEIPVPACCAELQHLEIEPNSIRQLTDNEKIVLSYIHSVQRCKVSYNEIDEWAIWKELKNIDIITSFEMLDESKIGKMNDSVENTEFTVPVPFLRWLLDDDSNCSNDLSNVVTSCKYLSKDRFLFHWDQGDFNESDLLFISYIIDKHISVFGVWPRQESQIDSVKNWEEEHKLRNTLSRNYRNCVDKFHRLRLVYINTYTDAKYPKCVLCKSLKELLPHYLTRRYNDELRQVMVEHLDVLPWEGQ